MPANAPSSPTERAQGRELDALIAEKVMGDGVQWCDEVPGGDLAGGPWRTNRPGPVPAYSTDIAAAWEVFEWLRGQRTNVGLFADNGFGCTAWDVDEDGRASGGAQASAPTAPLAICLAALRAVTPRSAPEEEG